MDERVLVGAAVHVREEVGGRGGRSPQPIATGLIEELDVDFVVWCGGVDIEPHERARDGGIVVAARQVDRGRGSRQRQNEIGKGGGDRHRQHPAGLERLNPQVTAATERFFLGWHADTISSGTESRYPYPQLYVARTGSVHGAEFSVSSGPFPAQEPSPPPPSNRHKTTAKGSYPQLALSSEVAGTRTQDQRMKSPDEPDG